MHRAYLFTKNRGLNNEPEHDHHEDETDTGPPISTSHADSSCGVNARRHAAKADIVGLFGLALA